MALSIRIRSRRGCWAVKYACDLPKDLQSVIEGKYPGTKIVTLSDLNEDDKQLFQK